VGFPPPGDVEAPEPDMLTWSLYTFSSGTLCAVGSAHIAGMELEFRRP
jgi:hypothetical protein